MNKRICGEKNTWIKKEIQLPLDANYLIMFARNHGNWGQAANQRQKAWPTSCQSFLVHSAETLILGTRGLALTCCIRLQKPSLWRIKQTQKICPSLVCQQRTIRKAKRSRTRKQQKLQRRTWSDSETNQGWRSKLPFRGGRTWARWEDSPSTLISQHS